MVIQDSKWIRHWMSNVHNMNINMIIFKHSYRQYEMKPFELHIPGSVS